MRTGPYFHPFARLFVHNTYHTEPLLHTMYFRCVSPFFLVIVVLVYYSHYYFTTLSLNLIQILCIMSKYTIRLCPCKTPSSDIFLLKILHTHWLSEIESLNHMHAAAHDFFELLLCLHAFHADFNVNRLGKLGYHLHESV